MGAGMQHRIWREALLHLVAVALTLVILWHAAELVGRDWRYPAALWAAGDGPYYCAMTKVMLETGWVTRHPGLGAPEGIDFHDLPHFESLQWLIMKLIGYAVPHWAGVLNVYYVLTYVLATATALAVFRHLKIPAVAALALALMFSFQPYHFYHSQQHIMLSGYYLMPLQTLVLVWLLSPSGLCDAEGVPLTRSRRLWAACLIAAVASFVNHYYTAFFALAWLAGAAHAASQRAAWAPISQAVILWGVIGVACTLNLAPCLAYWAREGGNRPASAKSPRLAEEYGLRLAPMLLPVRGHRVPALAALSERYAGETWLEKREQEPVGLLAGAGLLLLAAAALFGHGRIQAPLPGLGAVTLVLLLAGTTSGLGAVFAWVVSPQLYGLDRLTPVLALLGLLGWGLLAAGGPPRPALWSAVGVLALLDVLPPRTPHHHPERTNTQFEADARFGAAIQAALPAGTLIHQMPSGDLPWDGYAGLHLFLSTEGFRWTTPAVMNRPAARRNGALEGLAPVEVLERLAVLGVGAVVLDRRREGARMDAIASELGRLGAPRIDAGDGRSLYDLRGWGRRFRQGLDVGEMSWRRLAASCPVYVDWGPGFRGEERRWDGDPDWRSWRWCRAREGTLTFVNAHDGPLDVRVRLRLFGGGPFRLSGWLLPARTALPGEVVCVERRLSPGRHEMEVALHGEGMAPEAGGLWFRVESLSVEVVRPGLVAGR